MIAACKEIVDVFIVVVRLQVPCLRTGVVVPADKVNNFMDTLGFSASCKKCHTSCLHAACKALKESEATKSTLANVFQGIRT